MRKLNSGDVHLLMLIEKESACPSGWAVVSTAVGPLVKGLPEELVEFRQDTGSESGLVCLTSEGKQFVKALMWL